MDSDDADAGNSVTYHFFAWFIADPIINLYVDPADTIYFSEVWQPSASPDALAASKKTAWLNHLIKGLASLGFLSFIKVLFAIPPWDYLNLRSSGVVSSGRNTGRSRVASIGWLVILVGVGSFLWVCSRHQCPCRVLTKPGCL